MDAVLLNAMQGGLICAEVMVAGPDQQGRLTKRN
jgi:hypothetical protein